ncbi:uncharacterized protein LOC121974337 isoform X2 [Zingiber officinale]|uniref:uncharacterized protein LOC121974337 isoform X2 n=1 Tax=Zingiber officinale TaxID=94328 RepID=UPI001C4B5D6F|nr:uncharacterized protein LOC121974337 isoform X2 [Zingiber officinale]
MSKAGDAVAPLLPVELRPSETPSASVPGAVFNLATTTIGAGIMSLPAAVKVLGVAPALVLVVAAAFLADASAEFLMRYRGAGGAWSYAAAMGDAFGRAGSAALQICVALTTAGTLTVYLDIIGDVLSGSQSEGAAHAGILQEWFGEQWWTARVAAQLVAVVIVILPLVLLRRVASRLPQVLVGGVGAAGGCVHVHKHRHGALRPIPGSDAEAQAAPRLRPPLLLPRPLHRRPHHCRRLHLPLQRSPDPSRAQRDLRHAGGRPSLRPALLRHLRRDRILRLPSLRRGHHDRHPLQLRPRHRLGLRESSQRRGPPQLCPPPGSRLPVALLLVENQRRRAPLPQIEPPLVGRSPVHAAHDGAAWLHLPGLSPHPEHLDSVSVHRVDHCGLHLVNFPGGSCSEGR